MHHPDFNLTVTNLREISCDTYGFYLLTNLLFYNMAESFFRTTLFFEFHRSVYNKNEWFWSVDEIIIVFVLNAKLFNIILWVYDN